MLIEYDKAFIDLSSIIYLHLLLTTPPLLQHDTADCIAEEAEQGGPPAPHDPGGPFFEPPQIKNDPEQRKHSSRPLVRSGRTA
jgi:hypothetical protein